MAGSVEGKVHAYMHAPMCLGGKDRMQVWRPTDQEASMSSWRCLRGEGWDEERHMHTWKFTTECNSQGGCQVHLTICKLVMRTQKNTEGILILIDVDQLCI